MDNINVKLHLDKVMDILEGAVTAGMTRVCNYTVGEVKRTLSKPGTGRKYRRGKKWHTASAPGEPPAVDTGRLRSSITYNVKKDGNVVTGLVGSHVKYAASLEFGTRKMKARPFLRPAVANNKAKIVEEFVSGAKR